MVEVRATERMGLNEVEPGRARTRPQTTGAVGRPPPGPGGGDDPAAVHPDQAGLGKRRDHGVGARLLPEGGETDALPGAEPQGQGLQADLVRGEGFGLRHRGFAGVQGGAIFLHGRKIPPAAPGQEGMRPRAQPQVGGPGPVLQVVAAAVAQVFNLWSLPGEIGHFVVEIASRREEVGGEEEKFPLGLFIREAEFPRPPPAIGGPWGSRAPGSAGSRKDVPGLKLRAVSRVLSPGVEALPRQPVHQVQPQVGETRGPDQFDGRNGLGGGVAALQKAQFGLVKGLDPQAQAVNPQVPVERQLVRR